MNYLHVLQKRFENLTIWVGSCEEIMTKSLFNRNLTKLLLRTSPICVLSLQVEDELGD